MFLSATIITFNEQRNIVRCIDSLQGVADEIIVIDSFSTDKTVEIAVSKGAKVFQQQWDGYGKTKNFAAQRARHEYILSIDADEAISLELRKSISDAKSKGLSGVYELNRLTNYCGKWIHHCGWYPDRKIRLYPKSKAEWNTVIIHEEIVLKENLEKTFLKGDLHHYSYYTLEEHGLKARKYAEMGAQCDLHKKNNFLFLRSFFAAYAKFMKMYFFQLGFLDGAEGITICKISAYAVYWKYSAKRRFLTLKEKKTALQKVIFSRTDSIGDVILTLPMLGIFKKKFPGCKIIFLGRKYTGAIARCCENIDEFIDWDVIKAKPEKEQKDFLMSLKADAIVHVFPNKKIAFLARQAGIPLRIGTSHRIEHWLTCNKRMNFTRKNSVLHEAQLNLKLLEPFGINHRDFGNIEDLTIHFGLKKINNLSENLNSLLDKNKFNLILHPKSKGSAREWGLNNFAGLIKMLPQEKFKIFITGTSAEKELMHEFMSENSSCVDLTGKLSLEELISFIKGADGIVAASTGPLHVAAALGKVACGIYAPMRPIHPGRWAPVGKNAHVFVLHKTCNDCRKNKNCHCIRSIPAVEIAQKLKSMMKNDRSP